MATVIKAGNNSTGAQVSSDNTGILTIATGTGAGTTAMTIGTDQSVTFAATPTYSGGTANGVAYLNASKALTTGTGLVFDGTNLGIGTSSPGQRLDVRAAAGGIYLSSTTGTNQVALQTNNSGGDFYFGIDNSAGNNFNTGTAYAGAIWRSGANPICFVNNSTERMRIDSSGNLGLGVTPSAWRSNYKAIQFGATGALWGAGGGFDFLSSNVYVDSTDTLKYLLTGPAAYYRINNASGAHLWYTAASGTAGTTATFSQVMALDTNGSFTVVTRSLALVGNFISNVAGDVSQPAVFIQKFDNNSTTSQIFMRFVINNQGNACGQITANGANTAAFGTVSDERLKNNIVDLPSQLDNILALRPVEFDYIESEGGGHQLGFIAQEVQEIYPDLVGEREDGMLTLTDMNKNDARLIKAFQELAAKVTALEAEVAALKGAAQ